MRIGMMLRSLDEYGGIGIYTRYLTEELLEMDRSNQYVLFYRSPANLGRFSHFENVFERVVSARNKALWDQVAIPLACWREKVDLVFHPKFTVPLLAPCKAVMVVHGADWFIPEQARFYNRLDVRYIKTVMPLYFKKASAVISVSQLTTDNFNRVLNLPPGKVRTVYFGPAKHFRPVEEPAILEAVKARYDLPDKFVLTLSKYGGGDRKNIANIFRAYEIYHRQAQAPHKLVVGGLECAKFRQDYGLPSNGHGQDILFPGWIDQSDLPAVYSMADAYLYPSNLEAFPIPVAEAMACGTPMVTSNANGLVEIAGDAALLVDPEDPQEISSALGRLLGDSRLRTELAEKGLARAQRFRWDKCARETLSILESLAPEETNEIG